MRLIDADALHDWLASYAKHGIDDHLRRNAKDLMKHVAEQPTVLDTPTEEQFAAGKARIAELEVINASMADDLCSMTGAYERAEKAEAELVKANTFIELLKGMVEQLEGDEFEGYDLDDLLERARNA